MDAVIYAARSKDEEPGKDSTGDQVAAIEKQLDDRTVIGAPHIDHASGFKRDRGPGLEAAIAAAVAAAPSELWVFHSSRLARGSGEQEEARSLMELLVYLRRHGVTVRSIEDDAFVTNRMLWGVAEELSHKYSADLSAHTRKGKRSAREKGRWPGGPIPDGFRLSARDPDTDTRISWKTKSAHPSSVAPLSCGAKGCRWARSRAVSTTRGTARVRSPPAASTTACRSRRRAYARCSLTHLRGPGG